MFPKSFFPKSFFTGRFWPPIAGAIVEFLGTVVTFFKNKTVVFYKEHFPKDISFAVVKAASFLKGQKIVFPREKTTTTFTFSEGDAVLPPELTILELETGSFLSFENGGGVLLLESSI